MKEFFCSPDFSIGLVSGIFSGLIVSGFLWLTTYLSMRKVIIVPTGFIHPNQITINNIGKVKVQGVEITGLISYTDNHMEKFWYIKIDGQITYFSRRVFEPNTPRIYNIDVRDCIPDHNFQTIQEIQNSFPDTKLTIGISYHGKYSHSLKWKSKDLEL